MHAFDCSEAFQSESLRVFCQGLGIQSRSASSIYSGHQWCVVALTFRPHLSMPSKLISLKLADLILSCFYRRTRENAVPNL